MFRIGQGYDAHRFGGDDPLILGGVHLEEEQGLLAHSDGDVVLHSLSDALLGALALGDIGQHFPDNSEENKNRSSREILRIVVNMIGEANYELNNADITIVAQTPRISPYIMAMRDAISEDCGVGVDAISVKATTTEKMGFEGRKEGIGVFATVLLRLKA